MWCGDCNGCYCAMCSQSLHQIVALARHRPMPLSTKPPDPVLCSVHSDEKLKYWCFTHEIAICRDCLLFEHKDETYALIDQVAKDVSAKVNAYLSDIHPKHRFYLVRGETSNNTINHESTFARGRTTEKPYWK